MKMQLEMEELTEKDKRLLAGVACAAVAVLAVLLVIRPLAAANRTLRDNIAQEQLQKEEYDQELSLLDSQKTLNAALREKDTAARADFYPMMESREIDRMLTTLVLQHGLAARDLTITMPTAEASAAPYLYSEAAASAGTAASGTADSTAAAADSAAGSGVYAAEVSMTMTGPAEQLQALIDDLYADAPAIHISGYAWSSPEAITAGAAADGSGSDVMLSLSMEIYMAETTEDLLTASAG